MRELDRWELDPLRYRPGGVEKERLVLDKDLIDDFLEWSKSKGNSDKWRHYQRVYLEWWQGKLRGHDLRALTEKVDLLPAPQGRASASTPNRHHQGPLLLAGGPGPRRAPPRPCLGAQGPSIPTQVVEGTEGHRSVRL